MFPPQVSSTALRIGPGALPSVPDASRSAWAIGQLRITAAARHGGHRQRMQRLLQQGADPADEHRRIAVHPADWLVLGEPPFTAFRKDHLMMRGALRPGDPLKNRCARAPANPAHRVLPCHMPIIGRPCLTPATGFSTCAILHPVV
jgi:hypothetical protein